MTADVLVDWENFAIGLRCRGFSVTAAHAAEALTHIVCDGAPQGHRVVVVSTAHAPGRSERQAMENRLAELTGREAKVRIIENPKRNAADMEIAYLAGQAVERGDVQRLVIASADADLVDIARLAAAELAAADASPAAVVVAYVGRRDQRAPRPGKYELMELGALCEPLLGPRAAGQRSPTPLDLAAWTLVRAAYGPRRGYEAAMLHPGPKDKKTGEPLWWASLGDYPADATALEDLDEVLWTTQRLLSEQRLVVDARQAVEILSARMPTLRRDLTPMLDALLTTGFLRTDREGSLVAQPILREGLLMPARRALYRLMREEAFTAAPGKLRHTHEHSRYPDISREEADEAWGLVTRMLSSNWKAVVAGGKGRDTTWTLNPSHDFVRTTHLRGLAIDNAIGDRRLTADEVQSKIDAPWFSGRWLRVMKNAQLLNFDKRSGTYGTGPYRIPPQL